MHITLYSKSSFSFVKLLRKNHFSRFSYSHFCTNSALLTTFASQLYFIPCRHFLFNKKTSDFSSFISSEHLHDMNFDGSILCIFSQELRRRRRKNIYVKYTWFNCLKGIILITNTNFDN